MSIFTKTFFDQLLIYVNFCQYAKTGYFINLFWGYDWWLSKKYCNLIGWKHFGHYLMNKIFPKHGKGTQQMISIFITEQIH